MKAMRDQNQNVLGRRQLEAEERLNFGLACIEYGYEESFKRPEVLHEAASALIDAMTLNRRDTRAPFSLAYLFFLIEDFATAQEYLHLALSLDPHEPVALALQETLHQEVLKARKQPQPVNRRPAADNSALPEPETELDYDRFYDRIEKQIVDVLHALTAFQPPKVATTPLDFKALKSEYKRLCQQFTDLNEALVILDEELDTKDLRQMLRPLDIYLERFRQMMVQSQSVQQLNRDLEAETQVVQQVIQEAQNSLSAADLEALEENAEVLLDNCDGFADRLDPFESQGIHLKSSIRLYQELIQAVETLQDLTDNLAEKLAVAA